MIDIAVNMPLIPDYFKSINFYQKCYWCIKRLNMCKCSFILTA